MFEHLNCQSHSIEKEEFMNLDHCSRVHRPNTKLILFLIGFKILLSLFFFIYTYILL